MQSGARVARLNAEAANTSVLPQFAPNFGHFRGAPVECACVAHAQHPREPERRHNIPRRVVEKKLGSVRFCSARVGCCRLHAKSCELHDLSHLSAGLHFALVAYVRSFVVRCALRARCVESVSIVYCVLCVSVSAVSAVCAVCVLLAIGLAARKSGAQIALRLIASVASRARQLVSRQRASVQVKSQASAASNSFQRPNKLVAIAHSKHIQQRTKLRLVPLKVSSIYIAPLFCYSQQLFTSPALLSM